MDTLDTTGPALTATGAGAGSGAGSGAGQVVPDTSQQPASFLDEALGALPFPQK